MLSRALTIIGDEMSRGTAKVFGVDRRRAAYVVLAYHQVVEGGDGLEHAVSAERFRAQLAFMREHGEIVSVAELLERRQRVQRPAHWTYALTFDDGYSSLARVAHPILLAAGIPATVFLTTGFMDDRATHPWWDRLRRFVATARGSARWHGNDCPLGTAQQKLKFFKHVSRTIVHDYRRLTELNALLASAIGDDAELPNEFLDWATVRTLQHGGLFTFAPHTVSHPVLSSCTNIAYEIGHSRQRLLEELGVASEMFAYPYGRPEHFSAQVQSELRAQGVKIAFTTVFGHVRHDAAPLSLPRVNIGRKDTLANFAAKLRYPMLFEWGFKWREFKYRAPN